MSDFRCEWQALHGPRCSHQCNECKDNDTPPEPRMTSERQETEHSDAVTCYSVLSLIHYRYKHVLPDDHMRELVKKAMEAADRMQNAPSLRATPRAGSASKERGFFEWSCGCSLNNGLVTPCATHASPAAAPREHPSPEPYCASCDAREGEPCPHNVIQCARPRRAHPPRAGEVTVTEGMVDAGVETLASGLRGPATNRDLVRAIITAAIGRPS